MSVMGTHNSTYSVHSHKCHMPTFLQSTTTKAHSFNIYDRESGVVDLAVMHVNPPMHRVAHSAEFITRSESGDGTKSLMSGHDRAPCRQELEHADVGDIGAEVSISHMPRGGGGEQEWM
jgi:hypothetical protein